MTVQSSGALDSRRDPRRPEELDASPWKNRRGRTARRIHTRKLAGPGARTHRAHGYPTVASPAPSSTSPGLWKVQKEDVSPNACTTSSERPKVAKTLLQSVQTLLKTPSGVRKRLKRSSSPRRLEVRRTFEVLQPHSRKVLAILRLKCGLPPKPPLRKLPSGLQFAQLQRRSVVHAE